MSNQDIESFLKLLQMAMLPAVMISAGSLLLLSITNRLGRTIDRSRSIAREKISSDDARALKTQLDILLRRAEFLRASVSCVTLSIFFSTLTMVGLFTLVFFGYADQKWVLSFFLLSLLGFMSSLVFFMLDIFLGLKALRLDINNRVA